jgi:hypothetical protein
VANEVACDTQAEHPAIVGVFREVNVNTMEGYW